jgi:hypothetical protein
MATPANENIDYYANDEFTNSYAITDENDAPVDLSGKTLTFQARKQKTSSTTVIDISTASEITISGANNNIVTFSGKYDLDERSYYYDLENTTDSETLMEGLFEVTGDVTRV